MQTSNIDLQEYIHLILLHLFPLQKAKAISHNKMLISLCVCCMMPICRGTSQWKSSATMTSRLDHCGWKTHTDRFPVSIILCPSEFWPSRGYITLPSVNPKEFGNGHNYIFHFYCFTPSLFPDALPTHLSSCVYDQIRKHFLFHFFFLNERGQVRIPVF